MHNRFNPAQKKIYRKNKTVFSFAYQADLDAAYAFYCARYENISYKDFLDLGLIEFKKKLNSIPKDEPLYEIIQSRTINIGKIKNKEEKKHWIELRKINAIPQIYLPRDEIDREVKRKISQRGVL